MASVDPLCGPRVVLECERLGPRAASTGSSAQPADPVPHALVPLDAGLEGSAAADCGHPQPRHPDAGCNASAGSQPVVDCSFLPGRCVSSRFPPARGGSPSDLFLSSSRSSPHARGNPSGRTRSHVRHRFNPARGGQPSPRHPAPPGPGVHPRARCGGVHEPESLGVDDGSSARAVRGLFTNRSLRFCRVHPSSALVLWKPSPVRSLPLTVPAYRCSLQLAGWIRIFNWYHATSPVSISSRRRSLLRALATTARQGLVVRRCISAAWLRARLPSWRSPV